MAGRLSTGVQNLLAGISTDLVSNGGFGTDTTGWTVSSSTATLSSVASGQAGNCLQVAEAAGADPGRCYQDISTNTGQLYRLKLYFKKGTADSGKYHVGTTSTYNATYSSAALSDADWTLYTTYFIAPATTTRITLESTDATVGETSLFDTISLVCMSHSLQDIFNGASIKFYTGTQPADPDNAPTGTLLVTVNNGGSGITFQDASALRDGYISKSEGETWTGTGVADGTVGWFRLCLPNDSGTSSTTDPRIDGAVATSGGQINFPSLTFANGATQTVSDLTLTVKYQA